MDKGTKMYKWLNNLHLIPLDTDTLAYPGAELQCLLLQVLALGH